MSKSLTLEQQKIVKHIDGHALVRAVPGSGKTTTLIMRVKYLISRGIAPENILILMYNKAAQVSFQEKLKVAIIKYNVPNSPEVKTFNSYALKLIKEAQQSKLIKRKSLVRPEDHKYQELLRECYFYGKQIESRYLDNNEVEKLELNISNWRLENLTADDLEHDPNYKEVDAINKRAYRKYCELLEQYNLRTFDDSLIEAVQLLRSNQFPIPELTHIIVDEYQDVNYIQNELIKSLTTEYTSVMVVGDVNQCIYKWRGSRPDFIEGIFERDFKKSTVFNLSCTFRYGHQLAYIANSVISKNKDSNSSFCISHPNNSDTEVSIHQGGDLIELLQLCEKSSTNYSTAIIARSNADLIAPEIILKILKLPYNTKTTQQKLVTRPEITLFTLLMCLAIDGDFRKLFPIKNIKPLIKNFMKQLGFRLPKGMLNEITEETARNSEQFLEIIKDKGILSQSVNCKLFNSIQAINKSYKSEDKSSDLYRDFNDKDLFSNVSESTILRRESNDQLRGISVMEQLLDTFEITVGDLLSTLIVPKEHQEDDVRFHLTTMHGSKGLEWSNVILIGLNDKVYPGLSNESSTQTKLGDLATKKHDDLKEERRLFYVAITRAIKHLHLIVPKDQNLEFWNKKRWSSTPKKEVDATRFVFEMDTVIARELITKIQNPKGKINLTPRAKIYLAKLAGVT
ncbi:ATP-dependent helicase [uncultured Shewanella sp.]|uniref:ATP-dependent helicase n=1 Tax=uncultured Shewanella sp. TaxID=173975 RepID=UPI0026209842|nr:ATP-dependent helicase [uncultured Shewanella sp.]